MRDIEVAILAGGKGTRLREVVHDRPKPMAIVCGRPFLEWIIKAWAIKGIRRFVICTGHMGSCVQEYFGGGSRFGVEIAYSHEEMELGTGGALRCALSMICGDRFLAVNGDSYCRADLQRLFSLHVARKARATLWLIGVGDVQRSGSVELAPDGAVVHFVEKSKIGRMGPINAGIYLLEKQAIEEIEMSRNCSLEREFFPRLINKGLYGVVGSGPFWDIGIPEAYKMAEQVLRKEFEMIEENSKTTITMQAS